MYNLNNYKWNTFYCTRRTHCNVTRKTEPFHNKRPVAKQFSADKVHEKHRKRYIRKDKDANNDNWKRRDGEYSHYHYHTNRFLLEPK